MKRVFRTSRRSFITRVVGAAAAGSTGLIGRAANAQGVTDSDSGAYADPAGNGRGRGFTDSDVGQYADPVGRGRGV
mgnify:CR=1 FL=1